MIAPSPPPWWHASGSPGAVFAGAARGTSRSASVVVTFSRLTGTNARLVREAAPWQHCAAARLLSPFSLIAGAPSVGLLPRCGNGRAARSHSLMKPREHASQIDSGAPSEPSRCTTPSVDGLDTMVCQPHADAPGAMHWERRPDAEPRTARSGCTNSTSKRRRGCRLASRWPPPGCQLP